MEYFFHGEDDGNMMGNSWENEGKVMGQLLYFFSFSPYFFLGHLKTSILLFF